jgi:hypothetical protein
MPSNEGDAPLRPDAGEHKHLLLNPRGRRKAPRKEKSYDGKPTLHAPGCKSLTRTSESKSLEVPQFTLTLFDREQVWYCLNCLAQKATPSTHDGPA